jgi:hypothetical protein
VAPIVYILFNRPDMVRQTFPAIRAQRPKRLYLIADGPRANRPQDAERCRETRALVESMLDWECEVTRDYSDVNLGCGKRLSSGLTRAFAELGEAIVLEDDILPHPDFFAYCTSQLEQHRHNEKVYSISGFNPLGRYRPEQGPAVPTVFNSIWGWASWQRAWKDYRFELHDWGEPEVRRSIQEHVKDPLVFNYQAQNFDKLTQRSVDTWDFQWTYTLLKRQRLSLVSAVNLIENIGFTPDATHTHAPEPYLAELPSYSTVPTKRARDCSAPDRLHDKLYATVILTPSMKKIRMARRIADSAFLQTVLRWKLV